MGIADQKLENHRWKSHTEYSQIDDDFSVRFFTLGIALLFFFSVIGICIFSFGYFFFFQWMFPPSDGYGSAILAIQGSMMGVFGGLPIGQLMAGIILRHLGNRWRGNLHFGKRPVFYIIACSWLSFNICFFLLLSLILSFK
jgi:hypothetical protein